MKPVNKNKLKIIVVGSGAAGVGAARWLLDNDANDNNVEVILLESNDRVGGRVCTDDSYGIPIDLGIREFLIKYFL